MFDEWDALVERFSRVTGQLGKAIDPEIFETVVALNALGIPTVRSCGGRLDEERGLLLPWVDIEVSNPRLTALLKEETRLVRQAKTLHQTAKQLQNAEANIELINAAHEQANALYTRLHGLRREIRVLQADVRIKLAGYLTQFYLDRQVSCDRRLVLSGLGNMRLHNQGAFDCYVLIPTEEQRQKLAAYRIEMAAFGAFLKQMYFSKHASTLVPS